MLIRKRSPDDVRSSELTPEAAYLSRRRFVDRAARFAAAATLGPSVLTACDILPGQDSLSEGTGPDDRAISPSAAPGLSPQEVQDFSSARSELGEPLTPFKDVTHYNNFYEFGTGKEDPARNAGTLTTRPWAISVEGDVANPAMYNLEDFVAPHKLEDRIYRLRCVEAWSMVIPWRGFPLAELIRRVQPTSRARFVEFTTLHRPAEMIGQRRRVLEWPYVEGLRLDEAMNPLTLLCTGVYGRDLPNQNGAPLRLIIPWKYGFKSIKSIVRMRFVSEMPRSSWMISAPREYGFFANVNPTVDHPRWSQARERRIGKLRRQPTLMFNGYADQVASMYTDLDLRRYF